MSSGMAPSGTFSTPASFAVPPLPGATYTFCTRGLCASFHASACSRPPPPMTSSFTLVPRVWHCRAALVTHSHASLFSVPEVAHAREHHGDAALVRRRDHFVVAHAAPGLDDRRGARVHHHVQAVAERKESIRGDDRAGKREL